MQLSRVTPINIDVFEFLLPKLELMLVRPSYKGDEKTAEARFISYLQELSFDSEQTQKLIKNIEYWQRRVDDEYELMRKKADGYVKLYATNYNKYYTRTKEYQTQASRISSFMANIYTKFTNTEIIERKRIYDNGLKRIKHSVFDNSPINAPHVQTALWGLDSFSDSIKLAFSNLQNLFARLKEMFLYATKVDNLVEELRKDKRRVLEIFNKCKAKKEAEIKYLLDGLGLPYLEPIFPDLVKDLKTMDFDDFVVKYDHELNEEEFTYLIPLYRLILKENYGLNNDECSLYAWQGSEYQEPSHRKADGSAHEVWLGAEVCEGDDGLPAGRLPQLHPASDCHQRSHEPHSTQLYGRQVSILRYRPKQGACKQRLSDAWQILLCKGSEQHSHLCLGRQF